MKALSFIILLLAPSMLWAQSNTVAQFVIWKPKEQQAQNFENGYKQHLAWHQANKDPWNWYGWYFLSGPRSGQFIDATVDRTWDDFEHSIKPAEDQADNHLHVYPFADLQTVFKVSRIATLSVSNSTSLQSKFIRLLTIDVSDCNQGFKLIEKLKESYRAKLNIQTMLTYKMVDGGDINQFILMLGFTTYEEYGKTEAIQDDLFAIESTLKRKVITSIRSETLEFRPDMSYFPK